MIRSIPPFEVEMNDIKRRIDEIEAGGVDEKKKLLELGGGCRKIRVRSAPKQRGNSKYAACFRLVRR